MSISEYSKIQIPLKTSLKKEAERVATEYGYSSLQEVIRVFLTSFSKGNAKLILSSYNEDEVISPKFEKYLDMRLKSTLKAMKEDNAYTITSGKELTKLADKLTSSKK